MKSLPNIFELRPFETSPESRLLYVTAEFFQQNPLEITLDFEFSGNIEMIRWPKQISPTLRADELWKATCLEAFFSENTLEDGPYLEINCSPNGNWNAYEFDRYREGMKLSSDITVRLENSQFEASTGLFQVKVIAKKPLLISTLSMTAVIEFLDGSKSYWAIQHPAGKPDFHLRNCWIPYPQRS